MTGDTGGDHRDDLGRRHAARELTTMQQAAALAALRALQPALDQVRRESRLINELVTEALAKHVESIDALLDGVVKASSTRARQAATISLARAIAADPATRAQVVELGLIERTADTYPLHASEGPAGAPDANDPLALPPPDPVVSWAAAFMTVDQFIAAKLPGPPDPARDALIALVVVMLMILFTDRPDTARS